MFEILTVDSLSEKPLQASVLHKDDVRSTCMTQFLKTRWEVSVPPNVIEDNSDKID